MSNSMITSVSWNPRGQAKALPIVAEAKMNEEMESEAVEEPVAAPSETRNGMNDDDIVAKYGLENYDDEPGTLDVLVACNSDVTVPLCLHPNSSALILNSDASSALSHLFSRS